MDKGRVLGEAFEQLGQTAKQTGKQVVKTPLEIGKGVLEQVGGKVGGEGKPSSEDIGELRAKEEEERAKNLAITRQRLAQMMAPSPKPRELRPLEKIEREKQEKLGKFQKEEAKKPKPLPITAQKGKGTSERYRGVSG